MKITKAKQKILDNIMSQERCYNIVCNGYEFYLDRHRLFIFKTDKANTDNPIERTIGKYMPTSEHEYEIVYITDAINDIFEKAKELKRKAHTRKNPHYVITEKYGINTKYLKDAVDMIGFEGWFGYDKTTTSFCYISRDEDVYAFVLPVLNLKHSEIGTIDFD